ncbi:hypothetical protein AXG93_3960s1280 [Marchantia polymorpha subsp. ruderalis]|uniref:RNA exonuclease 4 n=1 Tax=Marchantia polymorpha subsp. ruderalis TaxID=1480154 RepID=A0A176VI38_MARPO|nr:hypothetical protein AXG93_3960s1280 [Marchantia polymorpha subsp. ruderalis]
MKRKRGKDKALAADDGVSTSKGPAPLSSNWLELQAVKYKKKTKPSKETPTAVASAGVSKGEKDEAVSLQPTSSDFSVTKVLAMDCEMVGVGVEGKRSALARVTLVNIYGNVVYDKHVRPQEFVTDFRTQVSGVRPRDLRKAEDFWTVQKDVAELIKGKVLVGHALHNDLKILLLSHPRKDIRDTQRYKSLRSDNGRVQALKHLAAEHLGASIQEREHDSIEDARAALFLYKKFREDWEKGLKQRRMGSKVAIASGEEKSRSSR